MATDYKFRITAQDKTKGAFNSVNKNVNKTTVAMRKLAGAFAGVVAVRQLTQFGSSTNKLADDIGKVADKLGVTTDFLQRMQFAAQQTGIETNTLNMGLQRFTRRVAEARNGTGEAKAALEQLGIALNDSEGNARSIENVLADVSDGLAATADSGEKVRLGFKFFDSEALGLITTLGNGSDALKELTDAATGVIPEDSIRQAEIFNDSMNELKRATLLPLQKAFVSVSTSVLEFLDLLGIVEKRKTLSELENDLAGIETILKGIDETGGFEIEGGVVVDVDPYKLKFRKAAIEEEIAAIKKSKSAYIDLTGVTEDAFNSTTLKENITVVKQFANTIEGQLTNAFTDFFDLTTEKFGDFKELATSVARAVINELIQVFIVQKAVGMVKGTISEIGSIISGDFGAAVDALSDFDGGGFTGTGVRAGGLDGKGGFMAMVHPNETVIDHTKGQTVGGATVNFNISTVDAAGFDQLLTSRKGLITQIINNAMNTQGKMGIV